MRSFQRCSRCIMDTRIPGIVFDEDGVCNYCRLHDSLEAQYPISQPHLHRLVKDMKEAGKGCEYDAVIGVSGGCDSSFMLSLFSSLGVRLLAVHMDNGWNTRAASENMRVMTEKTGVPLKTVKVDQTVFDSLCRSMLYASTPDADIPNDLALLEVMSQAAVDCGCHYVLNGHSFSV